MNTRELMTITGYTRSRLHQLRCGYKQKKGKEYSYKPLLIEGEDWRFERGEIIYFNSALEKIMKGKK